MVVVSAQKPGTAGGKFSPGTTAKLNPAAPRKTAEGPPVPPQRPRLPSKTDEIDAQTGSALDRDRKGVSPRAPSVVSRGEVTAPSLDIKEIVLAAVKEATAPLEARISKLEGRIALMEADAQERTDAEATRPNAAMQAQVPVPPPVITAPAFAATSPFSAVPGIPVSASAFVQPPAAPAASPAPPAVAVPAARAAFVSAPQINFEDARLSPDEVAMFDGQKRSRRMTIYFILVLVLLGGLMGLWASISRG